MLTKYEQETIINYNQAENVASIYTCDRSLMNELDKLRQKDTAIIEVNRNDYSCTYSLPKKYIKIKIPRQLSKEQRQELSERAKLNFGGKSK